MKNLDFLLCSALDSIGAKTQEIKISNEPKLLKTFELKHEQPVGKYPFFAFGKSYTLCGGVNICIYQYEAPNLCDYYFLVPRGRSKDIAEYADGKREITLHLHNAIMRKMTVVSLACLGIEYHDCDIQILNSATDPLDPDFEAGDQPEILSLLYPFCEKVINDLFELGSLPGETPQDRELRIAYEKEVYVAYVDSLQGDIITELTARP